MRSGIEISASRWPARLVVVYDSHAAGQRAYEVIARARLLTERADIIQASIWNSVMLQFAPLRSIATEEALDCDAVVLATFDSNGLSQDLLAWLQGLSGSPFSAPGLLAGLLGPNDEEGSNAPAASQIESAARLLGRRAHVISARRHPGGWMPFHELADMDGLVWDILAAARDSCAGQLQLRAAGVGNGAGVPANGLWAPTGFGWRRASAAAPVAHF